MYATTRWPGPMTLEEFRAVPECEPGHWQLVEGEVVVNFPTAGHQRAVLLIAMALETWIRAGVGRGRMSLEIDTEAGPDSCLGPDVQWWGPDRLLPPESTRPWPLGDVIVEVRSPSTGALDATRKRRIYAREGVAELWLVDPGARAVTQLTRSAEAAEDYDLLRELGPDDVLGSPRLPGFALPVAACFT